MEQIASAAVRDKRGRVHRLPPPAHHKHILAWMRQEGHGHRDAVKGFWTTEERFVGREQAARIALRNGQAQRLRFAPDLHSGDMW